MRDSSTLDFVTLRDGAAAIEASGWSQSEIADELGVHRSAASRAPRTTDPKLQELQTRIIECLTPYLIERHVMFRAHRVE
jgi:predicted transcriptional regulator